MQFKTTRVIRAAIRCSIESWPWGQPHDLGVTGRGGVGVIWDIASVQSFVIQVDARAPALAGFKMSDVEDNPDVDVDFQLEDWLSESGLNKKTEKVLRSEDITDTRTLALLEARDIDTLKLPLGQRKLLSVAVAKLKKELGCVMDTPDTADAQPALGANEQTKSPAPPVSGKATAGATAQKLRLRRQPRTQPSQT